MILLYLPETPPIWDFVERHELQLVYLNGRTDIGGEGRDSNPRVVLPTAAGKPAAALTNGDLSRIGSYHSNHLRPHASCASVR